jgi:hypothetical protein
MKKIILMLFFIGLSYFSFSQLPIGKNLKIGEKEIKTFFQDHGYHYLKTWEGLAPGQLPTYYMYFSEEFIVSIHINKFENITILNFHSEKLKVIDEIMKKLNFKNWSFVNTKNEFPEHLTKVYQYKGYHIEYTDWGYYQFTVRAIE